MTSVLQINFASSSHAISPLLNSELALFERTIVQAQQLGDPTLASFSAFNPGEHYLRTLRYKKAAKLLNAWMNEESDFDLQIYPGLEKSLKDNGPLKCSEG